MKCFTVESVSVCVCLEKAVQGRRNSFDGRRPLNKKKTSSLFRSRFRVTRSSLHNGQKVHDTDRSSKEMLRLNKKKISSLFRSRFRVTRSSLHNGQEAHDLDRFTKFNQCIFYQIRLRIQFPRPAFSWENFLVEIDCSGFAMRSASVNFDHVNLCEGRLPCGIPS